MTNNILTLRGQIIEITRPLIMGILNVTPDSFHAPSRVAGPSEAISRVRTMLAEGADIIDIGACSTRPGSEAASEDEEIERLEAVMEGIRDEFPTTILSVDTFRASVAEMCLQRWKCDIINDISGGADPVMFKTVARNGAAYVLMHSRGNSVDMDSLCTYGDIVAEVISELAFRLNEARQAGICNVIVDPGFGFAKTVDQNLILLNHLDRFGILGCPVLAGISRKRMTRLADGDPLTSTIALQAVAVEKGASILRVHDVAQGAVVANTVGKLWNLE